jgi:ABC-type transport system involved in cytochrome bd biosynthesis fused ATPase/permease subunit
MKRSNLSIMARLFKLVKPLYPVLAAAITTGVIGFLFAIFITMMGGYAILAAIGQPILSLKTIITIGIICAIGRGAMRYIEQYCNHYIAFKLLALFRDKIFKALRKLSPAKLESKDKGNLIAVITTDIELMEVFYAHTISPIAIAILTSLIILIYLSTFHVLMALLALVGYLVVGLVIPVVSSKIGSKDGANYRKQFGSMNSFFLDSLRGLKETIQYDNGENRYEQINRQTDTLSDTQMKLKDVEGKMLSITNTIVVLFGLFMLVLSAVLYQRGLIGIDGVILGTLAMMSTFGPVIALSALANDLVQTFASANRVLDLLDEEPIVEEVSNGKVVSFDKVSVQNVTFAYNQEEILSNLSMDIDKNSIIGISGKSGSGKSTLLKLMMRFWDVSKGRVSMSGVDIRKINTDSLRDNESFVTQDTQLFNDTIFKNIRIAKLDATLEEVMEACKKASIHDFIMSLPKKYDTTIGELGDRLSSGERQRIGLARAFIHNAPLILLDEPTSCLDSLNESIILKSLNEAREDKTIVLVSHRKSTMRIAQKVFAVENGRVS